MIRDQLKAASYSIIGDRASQQDAAGLEWSDEGMLAAVCDGMGGLQGGEYASKTAIQIMFDAYRTQKIAENEIPHWLRQQFDDADRAVSALADPAGNLLGAGSTAVAVMSYRDHLYWGSVGDSVIYYIKDNEIITVNRMHNYHLKIDEMLKTGEMLPENEASERKRGEALISFLGINGLTIADTNTQPIQMASGDIFVLASDGLYKSLDKQQILAIVEESGQNMQIASRRLCEEAYRLKTKKQDNTTVIAGIYL